MTEPRSLRLGLRRVAARGAVARTALRLASQFEILPKKSGRSTPVQTSSKVIGVMTASVQSNVMYESLATPMYKSNHKSRCVTYVT